MASQGSTVDPIATERLPFAAVEKARHTPAHADRITSPIRALETIAPAGEMEALGGGDGLRQIATITASAVGRLRPAPALTRGPISS